MFLVGPINLIGVVLVLLVNTGCISGPPTPLELTTLRPSKDQAKIARHYSHEAALLRQKAKELRGRAELYEGLFGSDSEWVTGTLLLARFYEDAAEERERLAGVHGGLAEQ
jgi:hypothetical protein